MSTSLGRWAFTLKYFGTDLVDEVLADGSCIPAEVDGTTYRLNFKNKERL
jgi:hypothetical protein